MMKSAFLKKPFLHLLFGTQAVKFLIFPYIMIETTISSIN